MQDRPDATDLRTDRGSEHAPTGVADTEVGGAPQITSNPRLASGTNVGRYVVLRWLGAGGMGVVYAAYDPELDRKVALKLLRGALARDVELGRVRLVREAQALARLAHPNVVAVHDVGAFGEQVFVAMEFVAGTTLSAWRTERPRTWREALTLLLRAGEGLAAAHAAGLVHRDFKPDNVMIGDDRRVRVMDFGLARTIVDEPEPMPTEDGVKSGSGALSMRLTHAAAVVGTPAYMAPEQLGSEPVDARADQFAFCVSAWETLYGERPFHGNDVAELAMAVLSGTVTPPKRASSVPASIRRALERGLAVDPAQRWPSMDALLAELARDPLRQRRRRIVAASLVLAGVAAVGWYQLDRRSRAAACEREGARITEAWNDERRARATAAITASGRGFATGTLERIEPVLDGYAREWQRMRSEVCISAELEHTRSAELDALARECLDERSDTLAGFVDTLVDPGPRAIERAIGTASSLPPLSMCADEAWLLARARPSSDPEIREETAALRRRLAQADALGGAGRGPDALAAARTIVDEARALGWQPLVAEALATTGGLAHELNELDAAERDLFEALRIATTTRHDEVALEVSTDLVWVIGWLRARPDEGILLGRVAEMMLERMHGEGGLAAAALFANLGVVHHRAGDDTEALRQLERALVLRERQWGAQSVAVAKTLANLGNIHLARGAVDEAATAFERAVGILEANLGSEHPSLAPALVDLGLAQAQRGKHAEARALFERALAIRTAAYGSDDPGLASTLNNLGNLEIAVGELDAARVVLTRALELRERALGPAHPDVAQALHNLGNVALLGDELDEALRYHGRALAIREAALGPAHAEVGDSLQSLADVHRAKGEHAEALALGVRAQQCWAQALGEDHPRVALAFTAMAESELALGRPSAALVHAERAVAIREVHPEAALDLAWARFVAAQAMWTVPATRADALALAERARAVLAEAGSTDLAEVETWLRAHASGSGGG